MDVDVKTEASSFVPKIQSNEKEHSKTDLPQQLFVVDQVDVLELAARALDLFVLIREPTL